ncbi:endonuclease/exonuclease/phosphatase family protein [Cupriavidus sp. AU9028]|uniref:endonuclease/exonuclease/phosphatase family protein n=1 Tax=Cupriavidus sp. AU9028 TaxID=2871157 RepID=UPI001C98A5D4|nr:endonuclease/exonuclease/phosphatase family protein [Cupriavidus sp. AU9028]MBY4896199.1 endonuclease/exonuclease/phosphatase family protein [Cupriavidus sp. AU9028]
MELISWNIQWGRGCDGRVDIGRIVSTLRGIADFDVLCLQEVARGYRELPGNPGEDQVAELQQALPGYRVLFAPGVDRFDAQGRSLQFGNVIATRLPVRAVFRHALPWPADPAAPSMPRVAIEATVLADLSATGSGDSVAGVPQGEPVRIVCTHLEYYSASQRLAQAHALRDWHSQASGQSRCPPPAEARFGPFSPDARPASSILCGDFNARTNDPAYHALLAPFSDGTPPWRDAWLHAHPGQPHAPTCGVHDKEQWKEGAFACDFMLVTEDLLDRVAACEVDQQTDASDHQPVHLSLRTKR